MTAAERELLLMLAEGIVNVSIERAAAARVEAGRAGILRGGHAPELRKAFARDAEAGEAWVRKASTLMAEVRWKAEG